MWKNYVDIHTVKEPFFAVLAAKRGKIDSKTTGYPQFIHRLWKELCKSYNTFANRFKEDKACLRS